MREAPSKDYFSAFIAAAETPSSQPAASAVQGADENVEKRLLSMLATNTDAISVKDLLAEIKSPPSLIITALHNLARAGLLEMRATADDECVVLTDLGRRIGGR